MKFERAIVVNFKQTNDAAVAQKYIDKLPSLIACDFETAIRYTSAEVEEAKLKMVDTDLPKRERIHYQAIANATALGHPSHCTITHCSIAISEDTAFVFIIDNQAIADVVLGYLVETEATQIWHNYSYDGRFIRYFMGKDAKNVEDTQIFAKTLLNHVDVTKANTKLKMLAAAWYGDWAVSADNFTLEQQYDPILIKYAAIDAASTFKLYNYLLDWCKEANND